MPREQVMMPNSTRNRSRAVVLLSGGMDSCVCAALASREHRTAAVHVSYGQRTEERERCSFESICDRLEIRDRLLVRNEALRAIGGSALTDSSIAVPEAVVTGVHPTGAHRIGASHGVTYVRCCNAHFVDGAVSCST